MLFRVPAAIAAVAFAGVALAQPTTDYLKAAGAGDTFEKQSSQTVLQTTKNPKIRTFANMMIKDHTTSTAEVKAAAAKSGVTAPPPALLPKQATMIAQLKAASGTARDTLYVQQQKQAHQEALAAHQDYASTGDKPALKAAAAKIVPVVKKHIAELQTM